MMYRPKGEIHFSIASFVNEWSTVYELKLYVVLMLPGTLIQKSFFFLNANNHKTTCFVFRTFYSPIVFGIIFSVVGCVKWVIYTLLCHIYTRWSFHNNNKNGRDIYIAVLILYLVMILNQRIIIFWKVKSTNEWVFWFMGFMKKRVTWIIIMVMALWVSFFYWNKTNKI